MRPYLKDSDWVRQAFLVSKSQMNEEHFHGRTWSSANIKFTDTTPGGNFAINPPPQFTSTCDIKAPGTLGKNLAETGRGMGRYYSEAIDDNSQVIYMRFGVPAFNSLTTFFTGFYNSAAGQLARTGRTKGIFYNLGTLTAAVGFVMSGLMLPIIGLHFAGVALRFLMQKPSSKFYYLKATMPLYWNAVNTMVNHIAVNRGIVPRLFGSDKNAFEQTYEFDAPALIKLAELLPDIFNKGGGIDVFSMAGRAQRLARKRYKAIDTMLTTNANMSLEQAIIEVVKDPMVDDKRRDYHFYLSSYFGNPSATTSQEVNNDGTLSDAQAATNGGKTEAAPAATSSPLAEALPSTKEEHTGIMDFFLSELDDGSAFASFRVNSTGPIQESFSNQVGESELAGKINGMSSSSRSTNFSFAGGNLAGDTAIGATIGAIATAATDFAKGIGNALEISGLAALGGAAFVDIPKHWQSSMAQLPRSTYSMRLISPYGNPVSQLINLDIPLAMLLAGALPIATGKQSYTSPFLVELYDRGRCQTRLGMIDSLSISRGTSNLGFNTDGHAMAIDVSFSIVDMSSVLTMPISEGFSMDGLATGLTMGFAGGAIYGASAGAVGGIPGIIAGGVVGSLAGAGAGGVIGSAVDAAGNLIASVNQIFDDDNAFSDYMAVLAGLGLSDQIYSSKKLKLNLTRAMTDWKTWYSPSHFASFAGDTTPARLVSSVFKGV